MDMYRALWVLWPLGIGVALSPTLTGDRGRDADHMMRLADHAMYDAKRAGGRRTVLVHGGEIRTEIGRDPPEHRCQQVCRHPSDEGCRSVGPFLGSRATRGNGRPAGRGLRKLRRKLNRRRDGLTEQQRSLDTRAAALDAREGELTAGQ